MNAQDPSALVFAEVERHIGDLPQSLKNDFLTMLQQTGAGTVGENFEGFEAVEENPVWQGLKKMQAARLLTVTPGGPWQAESTVKLANRGRRLARYLADLSVDLETSPGPEFIKRADGLSARGDAPSTNGELQSFFVSYNGKDRSWAEWIAWTLEEHERDVVIQAWTFRPGEDFILNMQAATTDTDATIAVLSDNYLNADYTQPEWSAAFARDPRGTKRTLIPVRISACQPEGMLATRIWIDLVGLSEQEAEQCLVQGLRNSGRPNEKPAFPGRGISSRGGSEPASRSPAAFVRPQRNADVEAQMFPGEATTEMDVWNEKLEFLQNQIGAASDADQKSAIQLQIETVNSKIDEFRRD